MDFTRNLDGLKAAFPVAHAVRRQHKTIFEQFAESGQWSDDDEAFYPVLARMLSADMGVKALRELDEGLSKGKDDQRAFFKHASHFLAKTDLYKKSGKGETDSDLLGFEFPENSFERKVQDFMARYLDGIEPTDKAGGPGKKAGESDGKIAGTGGKADKRDLRARGRSPEEATETGGKSGAAASPSPKKKTDKADGTGKKARGEPWSEFKRRMQDLLKSLDSPDPKKAGEISELSDRLLKESGKSAKPAKEAAKGRRTTKKKGLTDFAGNIDDLKDKFPVARSVRRQHKEIFEKFTGPDQWRDDDAFYSALAKMFSEVKGVKALRDFDDAMSDGKDKKKAFFNRAGRYLANNEQYKKRGDREDDSELLKFEFPEDSFERKIQDFMVRYLDGREIDEVRGYGGKSGDKRKKGERWIVCKRRMQELLKSLDSPDPKTAEKINSFAAILVKEFDKSGKARDETERRADALRKRLAKSGIDKPLPDGLDGVALGRVEKLLAEFDKAINSIEEVAAERVALDGKAREALESGDFDAEKRLMVPRTAVRSRESQEIRKAEERRLAVENRLQALEDEKNAPAGKSEDDSLPSARTKEGALKRLKKAKAKERKLREKEDAEAGAAEDAAEGGPDEGGVGDARPSPAGERRLQEAGVGRAQESGRAQVLARLLERDETAFAWHFARLSEAREETPEMPAAALRGLMLLRGIRTAEDVGEQRRSDAMAEMMAAIPAAPDPVAAGRVALAALLRPALFNPYCGARDHLRSLPRESGLEDAAPLIDALAGLGHEISLSEDVLSDLADAKKRDRLGEAREELARWREDAFGRKTVHQPTFIIFHHELHPEGEIGKIVEAALVSAPNAGKTVRDFIEDLESRGAEDFIKEAERRHGRPQKDRIEGMALDWFRRNLHEAVELLGDWLSAHDENLAAGSNRQADAQRRAAGAVREALGRCQDEAAEDSPRFAGTLAAASGAVLRRGMADLRGLLDGAGTLDEPRRIRNLAERPLLRLPGGCQDWSGEGDSDFDGERERREERLMQALSSPDGIAVDFREAFDRRVGEKAILPAKRLLEAMKASKRDWGAERAEELEQTLDEACEAARREARGRVERLRQSFAAIHYLDAGIADEARDIQSRLSAISDALAAELDGDEVTLPALNGARLASAPPDFPELEETLAGFESRWERLSSKIADGQRKALEALSGGKGGTRSSARKILEAFDRFDPATLDDMIAELSAGRDVSVPEESAPDPFDGFFPDLVAGLEKADGKELARGRVLKALREGSRAGPLDFSGLDDADRGRSIQLLEAWSRVEVGMNDRARPERAKTSLEGLLTNLGFEGADLADFRDVAAGKLMSFSIACDLARPDGWFLPPEFGSASGGEFRGAAVRGETGAQDVLRHVASEAPERPWLVVILRRLGERERRMLARQARSEARRALVLDESLLLHLCATGGDAMAGLFSSALPFGWTQPYADGSGPVPPEMFYGRKEEIERIVARKSDGCLVRGGRRQGKSTLLDHVRARNHRPDRGEFALHMDIGPLGARGTSTDRVWDFLRHALDGQPEISAAEAGGDGIVEAIGSWLGKSQSRRILAMFDDSDDFLRAEHENGRANLQKLHDLTKSSDARFKAVFAVTRGFGRMAKAPNSPLRHLGEPIRIGPMNSTPEDRAALIGLATEPMRAAGLDFADPALVSDLLVRMNHYPTLVQSFARRIVDTAGRRAPAGQNGPRWNLTRDVLFEGEAAEAAADEIRRRFQAVIDHDVRYECAVKSLALLRQHGPDGAADASPNGLSARELLDRMEFWPKSQDVPGAEEMEDMLKEMADIGVLAESGKGRYDLRNGLVSRMLGSRDRLETDLLALEDREPEPDCAPGEFHPPLQPYFPESRSPLSDADLDRMFRDSGPGLRLVAGLPAVVGAGLAERLGAAAEIRMGFGSGKVVSIRDEEEIRRALESEGESTKALIVDGSWNAKIAGSLARHRAVVEGEVLPVWCIERVPDDLPEECAIFHAGPWSESMVRLWLADRKLTPALDGAVVRRALAKATGGAPARLAQMSSLLEDLAYGPAGELVERILRWADEHPVRPEELGLDDDDRALLRDLDGLADVITSREEMRNELPRATECRVRRLEAMGLLREEERAGAPPKVAPLGRLAVA